METPMNDEQEYTPAAPLAPQRPQSGGLGMSTGGMIVLSMLLSLAFFSGYIIGRSGGGGSATASAGDNEESTVAKVDPSELTGGVFQEGRFKDLNISLYATDWCGYCAKARAFFKEKDIAYTEYDVEKIPAAAEQSYRLAGSGGVPVILIGGDRVVSGYSPMQIKIAIEDKAGVSL